MAGLKRIDLNLLVVLYALLEERNLTRAGERIGMSQPAMSGALVRLRAHFGDELLVRVNRAYELTPLAEALLPDVRAAIEGVERTLSIGPRSGTLVQQREFSIAISDYALTILVEPLLAVLKTTAPEVNIEFQPMPADNSDIEGFLLRHDLMVAALGSGVPGRRQQIFRDRFVCIADRGNPLLRDGALTIEDLERLPHARANFGPGVTTPSDRLLDELGIATRVEVTCKGLLPLPFVVSGTSLVAFVPERLARRLDPSLNVVVADVPFAPAELVEGAHWHPTRSADPALRWLLGVFRQVSEQVG
ncbi:LysR family transcriptional regulator [Microbispora sp. NPDC046933]|uniref:LysR family transcriptional regulator n=1 Tax=Microbispora sp. NPDC046933 TaxID=3155618 RepID=UPI0033EFB4FD